jgi:transcriptional regulator with GAF, ATPase, and Fis domain
VCVRDLSSTNGTFVDDRRTDQAWLTAPAILTFGKTSYRVVFGDLGADCAPSPRSFGGVIGRTPAMLELFAVLGRVAPTGCAVLLRGEPGTGKDRLAHAIHAASRRSQGPFVSVHAASLRGPGAHAQLFGDTRGAPAGEGVALVAPRHLARSRRPGGEREVKQQGGRDLGLRDDHRPGLQQGRP